MDGPTCLRLVQRCGGAAYGEISPGYGGMIMSWLRRTGITGEPSRAEIKGVIWSRTNKGRLISLSRANSMGGIWVPRSDETDG
jgi:hypothetical protein